MFEIIASILIVVLALVVLLLLVLRQDDKEEIERLRDTTHTLRSRMQELMESKTKVAFELVDLKEAYTDLESKLKETESRKRRTNAKKTEA